MSNIWFISDTHFCHNQEFIYSVRGFQSVEDMNRAIVERWNKLVHQDDIVYHLGDIILNDIDTGIDLVKQLKGHIRLAIGNHDTEGKLSRYKMLGLFDDIQFGYRFKYHNKKFLLSHYPQLTGNFDESKTYSIHGHTHAATAFCEYDMMYNVCCEAHNCYPISLDEIIIDIDTYKQEKLQGQI